MKSALLRIVLLAAVLILAASATLPAYASSIGSPAYYPGFWPPCYPWWLVTTPAPRTRTVVRTVETVISSEEAEGPAFTNIRNVNVRSQPSIYSTRVAYIRAAGTEVTVTSRAKNSSGEIWYGVVMANGTVGYIRSDLLNAQYVVLIADGASSGEKEIPTPEPPAMATPEPTPQIIYLMPDVTPEIIYVTPEPTPQIVYVTPEPEVTPQIIYVTPEPTPQIVYVTPEPDPTPQVIFVVQEPVETAAPDPTPAPDAPAKKVTPTPVLVYITPAPAA